MTYQLRHYQRAAISGAWRAIKSGKRSVLLVAATGGGKTLVGAGLIADAIQGGARVLFAAHRGELVSQCAAKLAAYGLSYGVIKSGFDPVDMSASVHVASTQTFWARRRFMARYDLVIFDEAHRTPTTMNRGIVEHCTVDGRRPIVIGLTATPYRSDGAGLGDDYEEMIVVADTAQLIEEGFLVPPRVFRAFDPDLSKVRRNRRGDDYDESALGEVMNRPRLVGHAVEEYRRNANGARFIAFCVTVSHSKAVAEAYNAAGIPCRHLDGETPDGERQEIFRDLRNGSILGVSNCMVLTEGFDEPAIEVVQGLRPTLSRNCWRQMGGRGLRICPEIGKQFCIILDHCGWTEAHGYLTDRDEVTLDKGLAKEKKERMVTCKSCGAQFQTRPTVCPACGAPMASATTEDTIGLGDASVRLEEDAPFFGGFRERREAVTAYVPGRPNQFRVARRARGL